MLNYLREIFSLLIGRAGRRSHLRVHLTIRNIFDLLTESANSNTKGVCMKASDNQGAVYVGAGSKPILTLSSLHPLSSLRRQGSILMNKSWIPHQVRDDKLNTGNDRMAGLEPAPTDFVTLRATLTRLLPLLALFGVFMSTTGQMIPGCGGGGSSATSIESTAVDASDGGSTGGDDIGDSAVMPPVGINAPMATLPDYGTSSTYTSSASTESMVTVSDTGAGVPSEMDGQYVAGTTDEETVVRIDSIPSRVQVVQERLAHRGFGKNRWNVIHGPARLQEESF